MACAMCTLLILYLTNNFTLLPIKAIANFNQDYLINDILSFSEKNGKRHLVLTTFDNDHTNVNTFQDQFMAKSKHLQNVYSKSISTTSSETNTVSAIADMLDFYKDSLIIIASPDNPSHWSEYLHLLTKTKIMSSILVFAEPATPGQVNAIKLQMETLTKNTFFYWTWVDNSNTRKSIWNRVITMDNVPQVVINELKFNQFGHIVEDYDMQGLHIMSTTVSWPPYIYLSEECKVQKKFNAKCKRYGFLVDALDALGRKSNFTWESHADPEDN